MHKQVSGRTVNFGPNFPDQSLLRNTPPPHFRKLQIWDDQSLLRNTPPISENFRFGITKVYSGIPPPPPFQKTSDLGSPKFTLEYPPPFRKTSDLGSPKFTLEYPPPPHFGKLQIWDGQSLLQNTPPPHHHHHHHHQLKIVRESKSES